MSRSPIVLTAQERATAARRRDLSRAYAEFKGKIPAFRLAVVGEPTREQAEANRERDRIFRETREAVARCLGVTVWTLPQTWRRLSMKVGYTVGEMDLVYRALDDARERVGLERSVLDWSLTAFCGQDQRKGYKRNTPLASEPAR